MPTSSDYPVLARLLSSNAQWAKDVSAAYPTFFPTSAKGQSPKVLWIGCADSRVPESILLAVMPGEIFVHRNIANQFHGHDDSALSVLAYAVDVLGVEHVIVAGHTACGGAAHCLQNARATQEHGHEHHERKTVPLERWLEPLTELVRSLPVSAPSVPDAEALPVIIEENVKTQVANVVRTQTISNAWTSGKSVHVHGWVYLVEEGRLKDLNITQSPAQC